MRPRRRVFSARTGLIRWRRGCAPASDPSSRNCSKPSWTPRLAASVERGRTPEKGPSAEAARSPVSGHRHGHRERTLMGTFGAVTVCVSRARLATPEGRTKEWRNASLRAYQRLTRRAEALIAGAYLAGTNTRRVRRALAALF